MAEADARYQLKVARSAALSIAEQLPEKLAAAVVEFMTGPSWTVPGRSESLYGRRSSQRTRHEGAASECSISLTKMHAQLRSLRWHTEVMPTARSRLL